MKIVGMISRNLKDGLNANIIAEEEEDYTS